MNGDRSYPSANQTVANAPRSTSWRLDLLITFFGLLGLSLFLAFYDQAFPSAAIELDLSRREIAQRAQTYLETQGYDLDGYEFALSFEEDDWASVYLQQTLGIQETNYLIRTEQLPIWTWRARWFRPLQKEEFSASLLPDGAVVGFSHSLPEEEPGESLTQAEAQIVAESYLNDDRSLDLTEWELVTAASFEQPGGRTDHDFEWKQRLFSVGDGDLRLSVMVKGDQVGAYNVWLRVPEAFQRHYAEERSRAGFFNDLSFTIGAMGFGLAGLLAFLIAVWRGSQFWYAGLLPALAVAAVALLAGLNRLPLATIGYRTTQDYTLFWLQQISYRLK